MYDSLSQNYIHSNFIIFLDRLEVMLQFYLRNILKNITHTQNIYIIFEQQNYIGISRNSRIRIL